MKSFPRNVLYALRSIRRSSGFAGIAIATIALVIGANTAIFSLASAALTKSLPYREPERLVHVEDTSANGEHKASYPDYDDWRKSNRVFEEMGGYLGGNKGTLRLSDGSVQARVGVATASFFPTLGVSPILGRGFLVSEELSTSERVILLSHRIWHERFGGSPGVLGRTIDLNGKPRRVVGILPKDFNFAPAQGADLWVPLRMEPYQRNRRNLWWLDVVARMKPSVSLKAAQADLSVLAGRLEKTYPESNSGLDVKLDSLRDEILGPIRPILAALVGAVVAVLLIACTNIAGLLLGRASSRRKEIAIRVALGARPRDLVAQLLTESLTLGVLGGAAGILWAHWGIKLLLAGIPEEQAASMPYLENAGLDGRVLLFSLALSLLTGVLFGLIPALQSARPAPGEALKSSAPASHGLSPHRTRSILVVAEIAVAIVLLTGAGLMLKSTVRLLHVDPGFDRKDLLTLQIASGSGKYDTPEKLSAFHESLLARVRGVPGVTAAGTVDVLPLSGGSNTVNFVVGGKNVPLPGHENEANIRVISANYFHDMRVPLIAGRPFDSGDRSGTPKVLVVNRALARRYFGSESPIGKEIKYTYDDRQTFEKIVGVVGDENQVSLDVEPRPVIYECFLQSPDSSMSVVARTAGSPESFAPAVRKAIASLDSDLLVYGEASMDRIISEAPSTFLRRYPAFLIGVFAAAALLLAAIGLYGIMAFAVAQRTREIGIRMALGAERKDVVGMILRDGGRLLVAGLTIGMAGALASSRLLSGFLFGVRPYDPVTLVLVAALLSFAALLACYLPARRAAKVDPIEALRYE
jgi:predicted permease